MGYEPIEREFVVFKSKFGSDHISIDDMEIAPIPVDHSIKGACGFFVYAPDLTLSYTGDLKPGENTREFIEKCKNERIDALITEGTRLEKGNEREVDKLHTEEEVKANCKTIVEKSDGMVFADFSFKDLDRVRTFYQIAKETERKFVISPGDACILYHLDKNLLDDENVVVYKRKKKTGTYANNDYYQ
jgi:ribonuclease J